MPAIMERVHEILTATVICVVSFYISGEENMKASIAVFASGLALVFMLANIELNFFKKIMAGSRIERQVARFCIPTLTIVYVCSIFWLWLRTQRTLSIASPLHVPHDVFCIWTTNIISTILNTSSDWLQVLAAFSASIQNFQAAGRRGRVIQVGFLVALVCLDWWYATPNE